jgi:hypothetical protein
MGVGVLLYLVFLYTNFIHYPVGWACPIVGIKAEPTYIPIEYQKSYATIRSCGKRCEIVRLIYIGPKEKLMVIATDYVSWADDPKWDKNKIIPGTNYYYQNNNGKQILNWRDEKEDLEIGLEYTGKKSLLKKEFIKIANSIKAEGKNIN